MEINKWKIFVFVFVCLRVGRFVFCSVPLMKFFWFSVVLLFKTAKAFRRSLETIFSAANGWRISFFPLFPMFFCGFDFFANRPIRWFFYLAYDLDELFSSWSFSSACEVCAIPRFPVVPPAMASTFLAKSRFPVYLLMPEPFCVSNSCGGANLWPFTFALTTSKAFFIGFFLSEVGVVW